MITGVTIWDDLTLEQYTVMLTAYDEAYLTEVIEEYLVRLHWAKTGGIEAAHRIDEATIRRWTPHFATVVADMVDRGWVEIKEQAAGDWDDWPAFTPEQLHAALADPNCWLRRPDGEHRMVMLMTTDHWDGLAGRFTGAPSDRPPSIIA